MPLPVPTTIATGFADLGGSCYRLSTDQLYVADGGAGTINAVNAHTHVKTVLGTGFNAPSDVAGLLEAGRKIGVVIPAVAVDVELHKPDAALYQPASDQATPAVRLSGLLADAVQLEGGLGFIRQIECVAGGELHPGRQLVAGNSGVKVGLAGTRHLVHAVESREQVALHVHDFGGSLNIGLQVEHR